MKLLVIFHVFYHDQVEYFIEKLSCINGCDWDLTVTFSSYNEDTVRKIRAFRQDAMFLETPNIGYDVYPFICALKKTDAGRYDCILKLHTKNTDSRETIRLNGIKFNGWLWREYLVDSILKSPERFRECLGIFESRPQVGMICCDELHVALTKKRPEDMSMLEKEATRIGLKTKRGRFCAGTMFMVRPCCLDKVIRAKFEDSMWTGGKSHMKGTLAHVYERILSIAPLDAGYTCRTKAARSKNIVKVFVHKHISPIFKNIFTFDRYGEDARKCLIVFGVRIMLE